MTTEESCKAPFYKRSDKWEYRMKYVQNRFGHGTIQMFMPISRKRYYDMMRTTLIFKTILSWPYAGPAF